MLSQHIKWAVFAVLIGVGAAWLVAPARAQGLWYVAPSGTDGNTCLTPAAACATLNAAITKASPGDTIRVAVGTYTGFGFAAVTVDKAVTLSGGWNADFTAQTGLSTLDGQDSRRVIDVQACSDGSAQPVVLERLRITHGYHGESGAGINVDCTGARVLIRQSHLVENVMGDSCCTGPWGGAGLYNQGVVTVSQSTFSANVIRGGFGGSAIFNLGQLWVENSTISGQEGPNTIENWLTGALTLTQSTVSDNGGIGLADEGGRVVLHNSILAHHYIDCVVDYSYNAVFISLGGNVVERATASSNECPLVASDTVGVDPVLEPLADHGGPVPTRAFSLASPALNGGVGLPLAVDQRGAPRFGPSDSGAYEAFLSVQKSMTGLMQPGGIVTYTLQVSSLGNTQDLADVHVTDALPPELTLLPVSLAASGGQVTVNGHGLAWTGTVASAVTTTVTYAAQIAPTALGTTITNTAVGMWSGVPALGGTVVFDTWSRVRLPLLNRQACSDFFDAFGSSDGRWPQHDDAYTRMEVVSGEYRILGRQTGYLYVAPAPTCGREAYRVQVVAHWAAQTDSDLGLVFGADQAFSRFYLFSVNALRRTFALYRYNPDGSVTVLVPPTAATSIGATTAPSTLAVVRNGAAIALLSNGTPLHTTSFSDATFTGLSWVGLAVAPGAVSSNADARFDDVSIQMQALAASAWQANALPSPATILTPPLPVWVR